VIPFSIVANKEITQSNSFMVPDSFSDETKVYLIKNVKERNIKLLTDALDLRYSIVYLYLVSYRLLNLDC